MIGNLNHIDGLLSANLPADEYVVINSAWLTLMGLRANGDLDLIISRRLRASLFPDSPLDLSLGLPGPHERRVRIHADNGPYSKLPGIQSSDDIVYRHHIRFEGLPFVTPRLYFLYKQVRLADMQQRISDLPWYLRHPYFSAYRHKTYSKRNKDQRDFVAIKQFFSRPRPPHLTHISDAQWGLDDPRIAGDLIGADRNV